MIQRLRQWLCPDVAIDAGTANCCLAVQGAGLVLDEPTVVALEKGTRRVLGRGTAVGKLAKQMLGRTPDSITAIRPIQEGVITDFELCEAMLRYFLQKSVRTSLGLRPRTIIAVPGRITPVEKQAVFNSAERAGAGRVFLLRSVHAAAIGAGLPISEPLASMVCEIGGGATDIAVFSLGSIVSSNSIRVAGEAFDQAIVNHLSRRFSLRVGNQSAELLKLRIGSASMLPEEKTAEIRGLDKISGVPRRVVVTSEEVREAIEEPLELILEGIRRVIEQCDPELVADLSDTGIVLSGGGAMLAGIAERFRERLGIPIRLADDPQRNVIRGLGICLEHLDEWKDSFETIDRPRYAA